MLLLLMVGNWNLRCCGGLQMYDGIYRDIRLAGSTDEASGHTQTVRQYKQRTDSFYGKESLLKSKLLTSPCCSCVLVCLSVAFRILNLVTDSYKSGVNILMTFEGHHDDWGFNFLHWKWTMWRACEILRYKRFLLAGRILCATGLWSNVNISLSLYRYRVRTIKMSKVQKLFKFSITMIMEDWEQVCQVW
jgi:hypothetical protein